MRRILIDTNILVRAIQRRHPASRAALEALKQLRRQGAILCMAPQNVMEFWNVCTRPVDVNGMGLSISATDRHVRRLERLFTLLADSLQTYREWRSVVLQYSVRGAKVYDARLVAAMRANGISSILTFNVDDFTRYQGIEVMHPNTLS